MTDLTPFHARISETFTAWFERARDRRGEEPSAADVEAMGSRICARISELEPTYGPALQRARGDTEANEIIERWYAAAMRDLRADLN